MTWIPLDTHVVILGALSAMSCALLGNYLVLRRMSMMGDAISHAVLPGIALAFWLTQSRTGPVMLLGAVVVGIVTAILTQWLQRLGRVDEGASMGVVFTVLFALGLLLIEQFARKVDLDPDCVLYGSIESAWDARFTLGPWEDIPQALATLVVVFAVNVIFVVAFYKELKLSSFDPGLATSLGFNANVMHYLLMTLVAITAVACFESVGSILVIAMFIVPPATAYLLTDRLVAMLILGQIAAFLAALLGRISSFTVPPLFGFEDTMTTGMMAVTAGGLFLMALVFSPQYGLVGRWWQRARLRLRILREDVLGLLYRLDEWGRGAGAPGVPAMCGEILGLSPGRTRRTLRQLQRQGLVEPHADDWRLTDRGRTRAQEVIRSHRLWEQYLHRYLKLPPDHLHEPAEQLEHLPDPEIRKLLQTEAGDPRHDPHGHEIPPGESAE